MTHPSWDEGELEIYYRGEEAGLKKGHRAGFREALVVYAWWCDGVQYVGCGRLTLDEALRQYDEQRKRGK